MTNDPEIRSLLLRQKNEIVQSVLSPIGYARSNINNFINYNGDGFIENKNYSESRQHLQQNRYSFTRRWLATSSTSFFSSTKDNQKFTDSYSPVANPMIGTPQAERALLTPGEIGLSRYDESVIDDDEEVEEVRTMVLQAAIETTTANYLDNESAQTKQLIFELCQQNKDNELNALLEINPELACCRSSTKDDIADIGSTPLHLCAALNNVEAMKVLVKHNASCFFRDLQGRTAMHIAAAKGHTAALSFLRQAMHQEQGEDPVGEFAPIDLAGVTPLGLASFAMKARPSFAVQSILFSPGDRSILPREPVSHRAGASPMRIPAHQLEQDDTQGRSADQEETEEQVEFINFIFGSAAASGWRPGILQDRMLLCSPLPDHNDWSLFCVADGHGGPFCADFIVDNLIWIFQSVADMTETEGAKDGLDIESPQQLQQILQTTCEVIEHELRAHPKMKMTPVVTSSGQILNKCSSSSGSTALISLITPYYIAIVNIGDSRAIRVSTSESSAAAVTLVTSDHRFDSTSELARAKAAGAQINKANAADNKGGPLYTVQINGCSDVVTASRSFGDFTFKSAESLEVSQQVIVATPDIYVVERTADDLFIVLASDGIWSVMSNHEVADYIKEVMKSATPPGEPVSPATAARACDLLLEVCLARNAGDNLSIIVVVLGSLEEPIVATAQNSSNDQAMRSTTGGSEVSSPLGKSKLQLLDGPSSPYPTAIAPTDAAFALQRETSPLGSPSIIANSLYLTSESPVAPDSKINKHLDFE